MSDLEPLKELQRLQSLLLSHLDFANNPICALQSYNNDIHALLPNLKSLDGCDYDAPAVENKLALEIRQYHDVTYHVNVCSILFFFSLGSLKCGT